MVHIVTHDYGMFSQAGNDAVQGLVNAVVVYGSKQLKMLTKAYRLCRKTTSLFIIC